MKVNLDKKQIKSLLISAIIIGLSFVIWLAQIEADHIRAQPLNSWTEDHKADCGVVLTGGPGRVREGLDLLSQGNVKKLIISGVYPHSTLLDIFPQLPFYSSIDPKDVILEKHSGTTYGNAIQTLPLVEALQCRDIILITSRSHMYRSVRIFKSVFPEIITIIPRAVVHASYEPGFWEVEIEVVKSLFYSIWAF